MREYFEPGHYCTIIQTQGCIFDSKFFRKLVTHRKWFEILVKESLIIFCCFLVDTSEQFYGIS